MPVQASQVQPTESNLINQPTVLEQKTTYVPYQTTSLATQLPGVISNPEAKDLGKYVVHQGGTHSQVGSVQSHRIISKMADYPGITSGDLDRDARNALGDVPQGYYFDRGSQNVNQEPMSNVREST